jgi:hypothetical protein
VKSSTPQASDRHFVRPEKEVHQQTERRRNRRSACVIFEGEIMAKHIMQMAGVWGLALAIFGCGENSPPPGAPLAKPYLTTGQIHLADGSLLRGGIITFTPLEIEVGSRVRYEGSGLVDAQGKYKIGFNANNAGVPAGEYKVTVYPRDYQELRGSNSSKIPKNYREQATTPLVRTVKEEDNVFNFDLK